MKRILSMILMVWLTFSLAACGGETEPLREKEPFRESDTTQPNVAGISAQEGNVSVFEPVSTPVAELVSTPVSELENAGFVESAGSGRPNDIAAPENGDTGIDDTTEGVKVLVAYFSATNTTKGVAENLADGLGADLYQIVPETLYTNEDLNYNSNKSRTTIEMNDPNARPAISGSVENMEQYDVIFLGYPIWWSQAPRIINTFVESYDFSGKTIVPFCTSGGSGMGSSARNLHSATNGATWLDGRKFSGSASVDELVEWADGLGLGLSTAQ